jgi:methionine-rich copper-binding protein CopC
VVRHLLLTGLVVGVVLVGRPAPVSAHAYLERAEPPPDAVLPVAPTTLRLWFTETLEPRFSEVVVVDAERQPVQLPAAIGPDGLSMTPTSTAARWRLHRHL